jgi:dihydroneopterin aldolase
MTHQVRHTLAETERLDAADKITVQNLEVVANAGLDAWGRKKTQRAFVTVTLALSKHFETAAKADALDNSTVHYGKLSKDIQAAVQAEKNWLSTFDFASRIEKRALETAGQTNIFSSEVNVFYPKGSLLGDGAGHARLAIDEEDGTFISPVLYLQNLRIPCIIGVNSNERLQKQSVVVNIWIEYVYHHEGLDDYTKLETVIVNVRVLLRPRMVKLTDDRLFPTLPSRHWSLFQPWLCNICAKSSSRRRMMERIFGYVLRSLLRYLLPMHQRLRFSDA